MTPEEPKLTLRIPGLKTEIGAGDIVAKVTTALGIKPCSPCQKRREQLNQAMKFKTVPTGVTTSTGALST